MSELGAWIEQQLGVELTDWQRHALVAATAFESYRHTIKRAMERERLEAQAAACGMTVDAYLDMLAGITVAYGYTTRWGYPMLRPRATRVGYRRRSLARRRRNR